MSAKVSMRVDSTAIKRPSGEGRALAIMAAFFGVLLLLGTFLDETIARVLYSPLNVPATAITTLGIYPFSAAVVFFLGVVCEQVNRTTRTKTTKIVLCGITVALALFVGFLGAASLLDIDCLGSIFPALDRNYVAITVASLIIEWPLFLVGWRLAGRTDDSLLLRRALCLVVVFLATFAFMQLTKGIFNRPRYRIVAQGLEGVGFVPWYKISPDPSELIAKYGLQNTDFRSFPSGHAMLSISTISILLSITWFVPGMRDKRQRLYWAGSAFAVVIMLTRMILGAHYLSDVAAGALIGLAFVLVNVILQNRLARSAG